MTTKSSEIRSRILIESDGERRLHNYLNEVTNEFHRQGVKEAYEICTNFETLLLEKIEEKAGNGKINQFEISRIIEAHGSPKEVVREYMEINDITPQPVKTENKERKTISISTSVQKEIVLPTKLEMVNDNFKPAFLSSLIEIGVFIAIALAIGVGEFFIAPIRIAGHMLDIGFSRGIKNFKNMTYPFKIAYFTGGFIKGLFIGFFPGIIYSLYKMGQQIYIIGLGFQKLANLLNFLDLTYENE